MRRQPPSSKIIHLTSSEHLDETLHEIVSTDVDNGNADGNGLILRVSLMIYDLVNDKTASATLLMRSNNNSRFIIAYENVRPAVNAKAIYSDDTIADILAAILFTTEGNPDECSVDILVEPILYGRLYQIN